MTPLYIIPARGGSKGIPRKNIKLLAGKPLIAYAIDNAMHSMHGHIILSTEDAEIASVGLTCGLSVDYMRPDSLATDTAGSREVILDAMDWADANGIAYDCVVLLQPTSPLRTSDDIDACLGLYSSSIDMVVSVSESEANPYWDIFELDKKGVLQISKGDGLYTRRQDAPKAYQYNGAVYVINPESIRKSAMGAFNHKIPYVMPKDRSIDLDTPMDWAIAESLLSSLNS